MRPAEMCIRDRLAKYFIKQGRRPMLVACDIYRPAAIDQLQVVGKQTGAPVFTLPGAKPPEIAKKALAHAKDYGNDIVILGTAGRLQIDDVLMQELVDIKAAVPVDETLLVVDAMAGQDAVNAVSYTQLDVYKRQLSDGLLSGGAKAVAGFVNNVYSVYSLSLIHIFRTVLTDANIPVVSGIRNSLLVSACSAALSVYFSALRCV